MIQSKPKGERKLMKKTPKRKTSVYLDKENLETIKGFKEKYNSLKSCRRDTKWSRLIKPVGVMGKLKEMELI